jgi:hypothetical protein
VIPKSLANSGALALIIFSSALASASSFLAFCTAGVFEFVLGLLPTLAEALDLSSSNFF